MSDSFKIKGKCKSCNKSRFFISKRKVTLPNRLTATSQDLFCRKCFISLKKQFNEQKDGHTA